MAASNAVVQHMIQIERTGKDVYRGVNLMTFPGVPRAFGGQLVAQALQAAAESTSGQYKAHSLHCYYIRGVHAKSPLDYHVDRLRDGSNFCTRAVRAIQDGRLALHMTASFQKPETFPCSHQCKMPDVPRPGELKNLEQLVEAYTSRLTEKEVQIARLHMKRYTFLAIDICPTDADTYLTHRILKIPDRKPAEPKLLQWIRINNTEGHNQRDVIAFFSDYGLLDPVWLPHPDLEVEFATSLDHSVWFHDDFKMDEWILFEVESPKLQNGRSLTHLRIWSEDGRLIASVCQEGLSRGKLLDNKL